MAQKDVVLGLDLGTSSLKGIYFHQAGEILAKFEIGLSLSRHGDVVEQDGNEYVSALKEFFRISATEPDLLPRVRAIGLSGHTPSLIGINQSGAPTFPVMIWQDNRALDEARLLEERFGNPSPIVGTSLPWSPSGSAAKAFWISRNLPEVRSKTRWLLQPKDFLGFLLTGKAISDPWSTKGLCNVRNAQPLHDVLEFIGWNENALPELHDGYLSRGSTTELASTEFGIPMGVPVSVGWSDAMCGMLALGVFTKPTSFIITGTSAIVGTSSDREPTSDQPLYLIPKGSAPLPVVFGPTQMSGGSIAWAAQLFGVSESELVARGDGDTSKSVPIYLPYIAGERAPLWRSDIRGSYSELSVDHGASAIARATMEGISFAERQVLELSQQLSGAGTDEVVMSGRAGNDPHWLATRLRTIGQNVRVVDDLEITCRGSAILAHTLATADITESTQALGTSGTLHRPAPADIDYGRENYRRFLAEQGALLAKMKER